MAAADKSSWVKVSSLPIVPNLLFSSPALLSCEMPLSRSESTIFLHAKLTEQYISEAPWIDAVISSAFHTDPFRTPEGAATPVDDPSTHTTAYPLLPLDDGPFDPPSATSGDAERVNFADYAMDASNMSYCNQPDDLYATFSLSSSLSTHDD